MGAFQRERGPVQEKPDLFRTIQSEKFISILKAQKLAKLNETDDHEQHVRAANIAANIIIRGRGFFRQAASQRLLTKHTRVSFETAVDLAKIYMGAWLTVKGDQIAASFRDGTTGVIGGVHLVATKGPQVGTIISSAYSQNVNEEGLKGMLTTPWNSIEPLVTALGIDLGDHESINALLRYPQPFTPGFHGVKGVVSWAYDSIRVPNPYQDQTSVETLAARQAYSAMRTIKILHQHVDLPQIPELFPFEIQ